MQIHIFMNKIKDMKLKRRLDSFSKYYNAHSIQRVLNIFAYHVPSVLSSTFKFPINT